ncbi:hypothetical protein, partial [Eggerthella sinensis]
MHPESYPAASEVLRRAGVEPEAPRKLPRGVRGAPARRRRAGG